ncbi:ABC transporter permease subunit [Gilliamella sp. Pas-s95]|uniref:ABC transporter permease subunit n=1 Tax=Gilliamella sp. Pas-s95 TaxID=2687317 RepID=UPI0013295D63|nr:ABC transporter permease subunit [Gilliamella sp. Pas-s95]MWN06135.1 ABC transporter permease subunit [Gilliamella sp. Pas-s95]
MFRLASLMKNIKSCFSRLHGNIYLIVGFYGILAITFVALSTKWFFHAHLNPTYPALLPPAWWLNGDINHILGTNSKGQDIFNYLLIGYRSTMSMTLKVVFYVVVIGGLINYLMFFISLIRPFVLFIFKFCMVVPPLLGVIVISLLLEDDITNMLLVVGLSYTPRFIYNIHQRVINEWNKTYITAYRLDGLSSFSILNRFILPNILPIYLTEIVSLFGSIILSLTTITFLGFANDVSRPDLGMMMFQMKDIIATNYLAFLSPGIAVSATIIFIYLFNFGLYGRRAGT